MAFRNCGVDMHNVLVGVRESVVERAVGRGKEGGGVVATLLS